MAENTLYDQELEAQQQRQQREGAFRHHRRMKSEAMHNGHQMHMQQAMQDSKLMMMGHMASMQKQPGVQPIDVKDVQMQQQSGMEEQY